VQDIVRFREFLPEDVLWFFPYSALKRGFKEQDGPASDGIEKGKVAPQCPGGLPANCPT